MTKLVHSDQTGLIKFRLTTDNVRRLLHVIDGPQNLNSPAAVLSDATKTFGRLERPFLWSVLELMGFGSSFINIIKVLYKKPTALVLTGKTSSTPVAISRGSRQGCPLVCSYSPFHLNHWHRLYIHSSPTITPISINNTYYYISLYANDISLYLSNAVQCIPHVLSTFELYGMLSGFK